MEFHISDHPAYEQLRIADTRSRLAYMTDLYARELLDGKGFEMGHISDLYTQREINALDEHQKYALTMRKEAFFYDLFCAFDQMYRYMDEQHLVKTNNIPYPELPIEFIRLMANTAFDRHERKRLTETILHNVYQNMGDGLFLYYQGLLYEYYCDTKNTYFGKKLNISIRNLFEQAGNGKMYLYDCEEIDSEIGVRLNETIEKADISEKYCKNMERICKLLSEMKR